MGFRPTYRITAYPGVHTAPPCAALQRAHTLNRILLGGPIAIIITMALNTPAQAENTQWACEANTSGAWVCEEKPRSGRPYLRPPRRGSMAPATKSNPPANEPRVALARNLDWVDNKALTPAQQENIKAGCCGTYIDPTRNYEDSDLKPEEAPLRASADSTESHGSVTTLSGDVQVSKGYQQVRSDKAVVDQSASTLLLKGKVQFREPGTLLLGDKALINTNSTEVEMSNATFVFHDSNVRGTAETFERDNTGTIYVDNATYTTCEPGNNAWLLKTSSLKIDEQGTFATARHVQVKVKDIPIMYIPWVRFPVNDQRTSGLLFPDLRFGDKNGIDYSQPIYLNLAPNYDATLTPRYLQERGAMAELEIRHMNDMSETMLSGGYLWDDDGGDDSDEDVDPATGSSPYKGEDRWLANIDHMGGKNQPWNTEIDYTKVSDTDYFEDLGSGTLEVISRTHLRQLASVGYQLEHWNFGIEGVKYQTLIEDRARQYEQLPRADLDGEYYLAEYGLTFNLDHQYTVFDHPDSTFASGDRLRADYALSWDKRWIWGYFRPSAKVKHLSYKLDAPLQSGGDEEPGVTVPVGDLDAGLYFERDSSFIQNHTQTFEPRIYYLYSDYKEQNDQPDFDSSELTFSYQQLFRDDRFSGSDRIGDADQVTVGFTSRLYNNQGIERLRASIGQIFYLQDRYVSLDPTLTKEFLEQLDDPDSLTDVAQRDLANSLLSDNSDLAAELYVQLNNYWRFQSDILFNDDSDKVDKGNMSLRYKNTNDALFNLSYRYTRQNPRIIGTEEIDEDINQSDISGILPLSDSWSLMGRWNHDLTNNRETEVFGGIQYNSCCWRVSLLARRWLERDDDLILPEENLNYDEGIFLQVELKGLAGTSSQVENILSESIYGYDLQN